MLFYLGFLQICILLSLGMDFINSIYISNIGILFIIVFIIVYKIIIYININYQKIVKGINWLIIFCFIIFHSIRLIKFFIYYEFVLIVILLLIRLSRYYYERYSLLMFLFVYILLSRYLFVVSMINYSLWVFLGMSRFLNINIFQLRSVSLVFLIKSSITLFHYWLLKVHCEVPLNLSILLSSLVLKLGRFGLIRILIIINNTVFMKLLKYLSLGGVLVYSITIMLIIDTKLIIAISSVVYMNLSLLIIRLDKLISCKIFLIINFYHSFTSLLFFWTRGIIYSYSNSRLFNLNNSFSNTYKYYSVFLFLVFYFRINRPPRIGFLREFYLVAIIGALNYLMLLTIIFFIIVVFLYTVFYYTNSVFGYSNYFFVQDCVTTNSMVLIIIFNRLVSIIVIKLELFTI